MPENTNFRLRVFFRKSGRLAMLSHLEVARSLERAIRRAQLPYAISQGFSPHMKIAFGAALPVGVGSLRECFDLQLTHFVDPDEALVQLKDSSVVDLMVSDCEYISSRALAASVAYPVSRYRADLSAPLTRVIIPKTICVIRKKKERTLVVADFLLGELLCEGNTVSFSLLSKASGSLRPDTFIKEVLLREESIQVLSLTRIDQREV